MKTAIHLSVWASYAAFSVLIYFKSDFWGLRLRNGDITWHIRNHFLLQCFVCIADP